MPPREERSALVEQAAREVVRWLELAPLEEKVPHLSVIKSLKRGSAVPREDPFEPFPQGYGTLGAVFLRSRYGDFSGHFEFTIRRAPLRHGVTQICGEPGSSLLRAYVDIRGEVREDFVRTHIDLVLSELSWDDSTKHYEENRIFEGHTILERDETQIQADLLEIFPEARRYFRYPIPGQEAEYLAIEAGKPFAEWIKLREDDALLSPPEHHIRLCVSKRGDIFTLYLLNEGVSFTIETREGKGRKSERAPKVLRAITFTPLGNRSDTWTAGALLEARCSITYNGVVTSNSPLWPKDVALGIGGLYRVEATPERDDGRLSRVTVFDVSSAQIGEEFAYEVQTKDESLAESLQNLAEEFRRNWPEELDKSAYGIYVRSLVGALSGVIPPTRGISRLRTFQYDSAVAFSKLYPKSGLHASGVPSAIAVKATTASGKTLAFLIPILLAVGLRRASGRVGTTALLVYPTRALAVDQAKLLIRILWRLNELLKARGQPPVRLGILAGETPSLGRRDLETEVGYRFRHPADERPFRVKVRINPDGTGFEYEYYYDDEAGGELEEEHRKRLRELLSVVRDEIYADPPDILITTPDTLNLRLMDLPESHAIFGRTVKICPGCGAIYTNLRKRVCRVCRTALGDESIRRFDPPEIVVLDEVHQLRGSFGAQASYVFSRLEKVIQTYTENEDFSMLYVFSSATFRKTSDGVRRFLRLRPEDLKEGENFYIIEPKLDLSTRKLSKIHLFIRPEVYSEMATLARLLENLRIIWEESFGRKPKTIIFVNSIGEVNLLLNTLRDRLPNYVIDGHSTDFEIERSRIEENFSKCKIDILVATSGLEVGVDFDEVEVVVIFGAPNYLADYRQRLGRAGRTEARRPALIVHIFKSRPMDYLYKRQYEIIYEENKLEKFLIKEEVPLATENTVVRKRSIERCVLDYLATRTDSHAIYGECLAESRIGKRPSRVRISSPSAVSSGQPLSHEIDPFVYEEDGTLRSELLDYIISVIRPIRTVELRGEEISFVEKTIKDLLEKMAENGQGFRLSEVSHRDQPLRMLSSLRDSDEQVDILIATNVTDARYRSRGLGIFMSKYYDKSIYSYMGINLIVDSVETSALHLPQPHPVSEEDIPEPDLPEPDESLTHEFVSRYLRALGGSYSTGDEVA